MTMKTFNLEANMKMQEQFSRDGRSLNQVGLAVPSEPQGKLQNGAMGTSRPTSKRLPTSLRAGLAVLLSLACLAWPGTLQAQPANYTNATTVANYIKGMLYWQDAGSDTNIASFRYKVLLYTNDAGGLRADKPDLSTFYGPAERTRAQQAESYLRIGLTNNPDSTLLQNLLLDIYYDRATAELILAGNSLSTADRARMGPPSIPTGLVIDDEINLYQQVLTAYRSALTNYLSLLQDNLGLTNEPPAGYQSFKELVPARGLAPATYLVGTNAVSVTGDTNTLFTGYKDLVLLFNGLRDYGRGADALAQLKWMRNNPGDLDQAKSLITDSQRFLFLETSTLLGILPGLDPHNTNVVDAASGLAEAVDGVSESLTELETMAQSIRGGANPLGFESDFLMLVQKFAGQSGDIFDSFDTLQLRLNPTDLSSPLRYADDLLTEERESYDDYRGYQDQLQNQLRDTTYSARDRLYQIVGAYPGDAAYETPENNNGSEIWQQLNSIKVAQLRIQKNSAESDNLDKQIEIEFNKGNALNDAWVQYGFQQAGLSEEIGEWKKEQKHADQLAEEAGVFTEMLLDPKSTAKAAGFAVKTLVNIGFEVAVDYNAKIGGLERDKEKLAATQEGKVAGIEAKAAIETLRLNRATLAIDSQEAELLLDQALGQLAGLYDEKADLERLIAETQEDLAGRYFADPVHHLRYQHQTLLANFSFDEAQKWLYFMSRALEYKWNTPFTNYFYLGRKWSSSTLFKLRNAEELQEFYNAMVSFNSLVQLPADDYFDWFSVREDFFGYKQYDETGTNLLYYVDPANSSITNLTAIQAFRQKLKTLTNSLGNITLNFSTVREIPGGTFFRGPRFDSSLQTVLSAGLFLDKIKWIKISLPGNHTLGRSTLAGQLTYGGNSFIRNFDVGTFVPGRPDRLADEMTAYSTRYWYFHPPSAAWRFSEALSSPVTMCITNDAEAPPSVAQIDVFKERSVATTGWVLTIPTQDLGVPVLKIDELDDVKLYFYHYAVSRQMPEGAAAAMAATMEGQQTTTQNIPFPYYLTYHPNPVEGGR
jgi:hypothetical protein